MKHLLVIVNPVACMLWSLDGERAEGEENILVENLQHSITLVH